MKLDEQDYTHLGVARIDSLRLTYDWDEVSISQNSQLGKNIITMKVREDDGEILTDEMNENNSDLIWFGSGEDAYNIKVQKQVWFGREKMCILLNSKAAQRDYLSGITAFNIGEIYRRLNGTVFNMTIEQFLKGVPSDIDIKRDFHVPSVIDFDGITSELEKGSKVSRKKKQGCNRFAKANNKGIEWNDRTHSTFANPFVKLYHKGIEGLHGSNFGFFDKYGLLPQLENRMRLEVTIRTRKDAAKHDIDTTSLDTLLNTDKRVLEDACINSLKKCLQKIEPHETRRSKGGLTNTDRMAHIILVTAMDTLNMAFEDALEHYLELFPKGNDRSRQKARFIDVYEREIQGQDFAIRSAKMRGYFKAFGLC